VALLGKFRIKFKCICPSLNVSRILSTSLWRACAFNVRNTRSLLQCRKHRILLAYVLITTDTAVSIIWRRTSSNGTHSLSWRSSRNLPRDSWIPVSVCRSLNACVSWYTPDSVLYHGCRNKLWHIAFIVGRCHIYCWDDPSAISLPRFHLPTH